MMWPTTKKIWQPSKPLAAYDYCQQCLPAHRPHKRLVGEQPLVALYYSDRYLRSPLTIILLRELLGALAHYPGGLVPSTCITIATSHLQRNDTQEPRWLYHDWRDATDRQQVFKKVVETFVSPFHSGNQ